MSQRSDSPTPSATGRETRVGDGPGSPAVPGPATGPVVACVKWVDLHPEVDPLTGLPTPSRHSWGFSEADRAALEVALRLAEQTGNEAMLLCAGPPGARAALAQLAASGAARALLVEHPGKAPAGSSGAVLAGALGPGGMDASMVVCGDMSHGRGSGSVPAVIAHHLGFAQALGLIEVTRTTSGLRAVRRLDGARREVLEVEGSAVISVEGAVATLRRAPLGATLAGDATRVEVIQDSTDHGAVAPARVVPWRPAPRSIPAPQDPEAFNRVLELTGALDEHTPPRTVTADPAQAAALIVEQLREWGYLGDDPT